jgi:N-acetylmuramoyl-L-alanine amidase
MTPADQFLLALAIYREARNQPMAAKQAVAHVILNRVRNPGFPKSVAKVIMQPNAFSSFRRDDPNYAKLPDPYSLADWRAFEECCEAAENPGEDVTRGATFFHSPMPNPPKWAAPEKLTAEVGAFRFFLA